MKFSKIFLALTLFFNAAIAENFDFFAEEQKVVQVADTSAKASFNNDFYNLRSTTSTGTTSTTGSTSSGTSILSSIGSTLGTVTNILGSAAILTGLVSSITNSSSSSSPFSFGNVNLAGALGQLAAATAFSQVTASAFDQLAQKLCSQNQTYYCAFIKSHSTVNNTAVTSLNSALNTLSGSTSSAGTSSTGSTSTGTSSTGSASSSSGTSIGSDTLTNIDQDPISISLQENINNSANSTSNSLTDGLELPVSNGETLGENYLLPSIN